MPNIYACLNPIAKELNPNLVHVLSYRQLNVPHITLEVISARSLLEEQEDYGEQIHDYTPHSRRPRGHHLAQFLGTLVVLFDVCPSNRLVVAEQLLHRP